MTSKKEQLLNTTKSLLWELGYESMSPKKILSDSGAGQGSLYHHFDSKQSLALTALEEIKDQLIERAQKTLNSELPPMERLYQYLMAPREGLRGCQLGRLAQENSVVHGPLKEPLQDYFLSVQNLLTATLEDAQQQGALRAHITPSLLATTLMAVIQGGYTLARVSGEKAMYDAQKGAWEMIEYLRP